LLERDRLYYAKKKIENPNNGILVEKDFIGFIPMNVNTTISSEAQMEFSIQNKGDTRIYYLQAENQTDRDSWVKDLKDRASKTDPPTLKAISLDFQLFYLVTKSNEKSYAEYVIKVTDSGSKVNWTVLRRYSDILVLHKKVRVLFLFISFLLVSLFEENITIIFAVNQKIQRSCISSFPSKNNFSSFGGRNRKKKKNV
jgi:hypothetical protein